MDTKPKKRGRKPKKENQPKEDNENNEVKEEVKGSDSSFTIKTVQTEAFRNFLLALQNYSEIITLKISDRGIVSLELLDDVLIHSRLSSENFEEFTIDKVILLHINLKSFGEIIKHIKNDDIITLKKNKVDQHWSIIINNYDTNKQEKYDFNLIKREDYIGDNVIIPPAEFNYELSLSNEDYEDLIKKTKHIQPEKMTIQASDDSITFICKNPELSCEIKYGNIDLYISNNDIISGEFPYNEMASCTVFSKLCSSVRLYIKNDYPLIMHYNVANLGDIKICIAPLL
tara:strand:- start:587 stop:1444 length:858 start_codon:yes stop_codon:yes gene_type:complete